MTAAVFALFIAGSLALAFLAQRGYNVAQLEQYLVAGRSFSGFLLFFLAVGEIYSIGTMIGFPGGIYAKGVSYGVWFLGYILLAYAVGYVVTPLIWRAGRRYGALTLPDLFRRHFSSRGLELVVVVSSIVFLIPWGELQFTGLEVALSALGFHLSPTLAVGIAGAIAFLYIVVSGVRAPAFVSILKDTLMVLAIIIVGVAAASHVGMRDIFALAARHGANVTMTPAAEVFAMSTIFFQAFGFYLFPFSVQYLFTGKSEATVKRTQIFMPLYMLMYPFLVIAAYYSLAEVHHLKVANAAFMVAAARLLPPWLLGVVAAGAALSGLLVLAGISLSIGSMVPRNLVQGLPESAQRRWTQVLIAVYLMVSIVLTVASPSLMLTLINTAYYGITQFFPGIVGMLFSRRVTSTGVALGIVIGDLAALTLYLTNANLLNLNIGLICLAINFAVSFGWSYLLPSRETRVPVAYAAD
ncbi:MAG: sodium:solute symporter family protein [Firmicutes bacterium]|nr:sodium:solute symporter family protein [Bacillota bacterium]